MLDDSTNKFAIILRNEDLQNYAGDAFYNLVKAVTIHDTGAAVGESKMSKISFSIFPTLYFGIKCSDTCLVLSNAIRNRLKCPANSRKTIQIISNL